MRKREFLLAVVLIICSCTLSLAEEEHDDWYLKGYVETGLAFLRNEIGVNLRRPDLMEETGGFGDNFGRYVIRSHLYFGRIINKGFVRDVFLTIKPTLIFGRNIPQMEYTWSAVISDTRKTSDLGLHCPGTGRCMWRLPDGHSGIN